MTADWTRLPYEVLERISTRITNEVDERQPGRARHHEQAAGDHRVGVTSLSGHEAVDGARSRRRRPAGRIR